MVVLSGAGWDVGSDGLVSYRNPDFVLFMENGNAILREGEGESQVHDFIEKVNELLEEGHVAIGYFGYEFFKYLVPLTPSRHKDGISLPDAAFMFFRNPPSPLGTGDLKASPKARLRPNMERAKFLHMVERIKEYIAAGDVYQVRVSDFKRFDGAFFEETGRKTHHSADQGNPTEGR